MSAPNTHLPVDVYSPDQLSSLIIELRTYRGHLRDASARVKTSAKPKAEKPDTDISEGLAGLLNANGVAGTDGPALEALQKELDSTLKTAPIMHMTLAAPAGRQLKRQLTVWFRASIHPAALLTFAARSDIGGGVILQAGSHLYDYSFRSRILANKSRLTGIAGV